MIITPTNYYIVLLICICSSWLSCCRMSDAIRSILDTIMHYRLSYNEAYAYDEIFVKHKIQGSISYPTGVRDDTTNEANIYEKNDGHAVITEDEKMEFLRQYMNQHRIVFFAYAFDLLTHTCNFGLYIGIALLSWFTVIYK
jgi:hypothetical protein